MFVYIKKGNRLFSHSSALKKTEEEEKRVRDKNILSIRSFRGVRSIVGLLFFSSEIV